MNEHRHLRLHIPATFVGKYIASFASFESSYESFSGFREATSRIAEEMFGL